MTVILMTVIERQLKFLKGAIFIIVPIYNTFANLKNSCFGNEVRFPETYIRVSGNPLRAMNETIIQLAKVLNLPNCFQ